jgi:hypothetical protein
MIIHPEVICKFLSKVKNQLPGDNTLYKFSFFQVLPAYITINIIFHYKDLEDYYILLKISRATFSVSPGSRGTVVPSRDFFIFDG